MTDKQRENRGEILLYRAEDNTIQLDVRMENDTVWLTASQMAELYDRDVKTIRKHINNALREELADEPVGANFASTKKYGRHEGFTQTKEVMYYNLEMVTSVGFRVKSKRGVQFRKWANKVLKDYLIKGFVINEKIRHEQLSDLRQLVQIVGRQDSGTHIAFRFRSVADTCLRRRQHAHHGGLHHPVPALVGIRD